MVYSERFFDINGWGAPMTMQRKTRAQLEAEIEYLKKTSLADSLATIFSNLFKWGSLAFCAWCVQRMVVSIAGTHTLASIAVAFMLDTKMDRWTAYALGAIGTLYGMGQRHLRKRNIARLSRHIESLEKRKDPRRSSSELTQTGDTRPEDKR